MKEKKKRKILAALIPVAVFLLAAVVFAQGVLKSEPEAVPNPVQGISADSSLKGYLELVLPMPVPTQTETARKWQNSRNRHSFFQKRHRLLWLHRSRQKNQWRRR